MTAKYDQADEYGFSTLTPENRHELRKLCVFGYPISASLSPDMHNAAYKALGLPWKFSRVETKSKEDLQVVISDPAFIGASITIPHKIVCMPDMDYLTPEANAIGAINVVYVRQHVETGKRVFIGTNTDCHGVRDGVIKNFPSHGSRLAGKPAAVLGGGGACRAAVYAVSELMGASVVYLVNRDAEEVRAVIEAFRQSGHQGKLVHITSASQAKDLVAPVVIIGTVPDISPQTKEEIETRNIMTTFLQGLEKGVLLDMCYHPLVTTLMTLAKEAGWEVVSGTEALLYQGTRACALWTGTPIELIPVDEMRAAMQPK